MGQNWEKSAKFEFQCASLDLWTGLPPVAISVNAHRFKVPHSLRCLAAVVFSLVFYSFFFGGLECIQPFRNSREISSTVILAEWSTERRWRCRKCWWNDSSSQTTDRLQINQSVNHRRSTRTLTFTVHQTVIRCWLSSMIPSTRWAFEATNLRKLTLKSFEIEGRISIGLIVAVWLHSTDRANWWRILS